MKSVCIVPIKRNVSLFKVWFHFHFAQNCLPSLLCSNFGNVGGKKWKANKTKICSITGTKHRQKQPSKSGVKPLSFRFSLPALEGSWRFGKNGEKQQCTLHTVPTDWKNCAWLARVGPLASRPKPAMNERDPKEHRHSLEQGSHIASRNSCSLKNTLWGVGAC